MIDILITLVSGIFMLVFRFLYYNIAKKNHQNYTYHSCFNYRFIYEFRFRFFIACKNIFALIGIPMSYFSLTEKNNLLSEIYRTKMSKTFIFIIF